MSVAGVSVLAAVWLPAGGSATVADRLVERDLDIASRRSPCRRPAAGTEQVDQRLLPGVAVADGRADGDDAWRKRARAAQRRRGGVSGRTRSPDDVRLHGADALRPACHEATRAPAGLPTARLMHAARSLASRSTRRWARPRSWGRSSGSAGSPCHRQPDEPRSCRCGRSAAAGLPPSGATMAVCHGLTSLRDARRGRRQHVPRRGLDSRPAPSWLARTRQGAADWLVT